MKERVSNMNEAVESIGPLSPREEFVLRLIYLRDDWDRNEGSREYSKNDGHVVWFLSLASNLEEARHDGILPDSICKDVEEYLTWWTKDFGKDYEYPIIDKPEEIAGTKHFIQSLIFSFKPDYPANDEPFDKKSLIEKLIFFRSWFDGIPARIVHSTDGPWKVRLGWFLGISADLSVAKKEKLIPEHALKEVDEYLNWWLSLRKGEGQFISTKEDISRGNKVIDKVLESLSETN